ncbi:enoyl-CoA hydratase/isomerase family protein [Gordonia sp. DT30]|uniref:enoyl-CoA hydratase/isomerase family protein n=1 Tax=Gordonia sp. DT30 TaxID=3416546 RepID=UPI003CED4742
MNEPSNTEKATDALGGSAGTVELDVASNHVAVIEFNNPPINYFDADLITAIADACDSAYRQDARVIILRSGGTVFCAGAEFGLQPASEMDPAPLYQVALRLFRQPLPMIAAIQGAAIGGGLGLALAADFRIASTQAKFSVNFAQIGIHHGFGLSATLPKVVGQQESMNLLYTGERIKAPRAHHVGLVDQICEPDELAAATRDYAERIAGAAPLAVQSIRRTLRGGLADEVAAAVAHERAEQRKLFLTDDFAEGVAAVGERRPAHFNGQ